MEVRMEVEVGVGVRRQLEVLALEDLVQNTTAMRVSGGVGMMITIVGTAGVKTTEIVLGERGTRLKRSGHAERQRSARGIEIEGIGTRPRTRGLVARQKRKKGTGIGGTTEIATTGIVVDEQTASISLSRCILSSACSQLKLTSTMLFQKTQATS